MATRDSVYIDIIAETQKAGANIGSLIAKVGGAILSFAALKKGIHEAIEGSKLAAELNQVAKAFDNMAKNVGQDANVIIKSLKKMSAGTISELDLIKSASKAALFGLPMDQLDKLMAIARASATATGQSISQMFDDIVTGISRGSPMILDNLGLTLKIGEATEAYAKSIGKTSAELTGEERKMATLNATLAAGETILNRMGDAATELTDLQRWQQLTAAVTDFKTQLGQTAMNGFRPLIEMSTTFLNNMTEGLKLTVAMLAKGKTTSLAGEIESLRAEMTLWEKLRSRIMGGEQLTMADAVALKSAGINSARVGANNLPEIDRMMGEMGRKMGGLLAEQRGLIEAPTIPEIIMGPPEKITEAVDEINTLTDAVRNMRAEWGALMMGAGPGIMKAPAVDLGIWTGLPGQSMASKAPSRFIKEESSYSQFWGGGQGEGFADYAREGMEGFTDAIGEAADAMKPLNDETTKLYQTYANIAGIAGNMVGTLLTGGDAAEAMKAMIKDTVATVLMAIGTTQLALAMAPGGITRLPGALAAFAAAGVVKALGEGGVVTSPTMALIGEKGPEAVIPLGRGGGMGSTHYHTHIHAGSVIAERGLRSIVAGGRRGA